jgi:hypothetical protein
VGLREDFGPGPVALDTAPFIYFIEEHEGFLPVVAPVFEDVAAGCSAFLTNDRDLPALPGLRVLKLRDYLQVGDRASAGGAAGDP